MSGYSGTHQASTEGTSVPREQYAASAYGHTGTLPAISEETSAQTLCVAVQPVPRPKP